MKIGKYHITSNPTNEVKEKVISFNIVAKPSEQGKGETKTGKKNIIGEMDLEQHPVNFKLLENIRKKDPSVAGAITKTSNMVVGPGFYITYKNNRLVKKCNEFMDKINFDNFLRVVATQMLTFGHSPVEKIKVGNELRGVKHINPKTLFVKRNKKGFPTKYYQIIDEKIVAEWEPHEITHFKHNLITGDEAYGNSLIEPVQLSVNRKLNLEDNMSTIIERKANAPLQVKLGSDEYPAQDGDISGWQEKLELLRNNTEWATNHVTEIKVVGFEGAMLDLKPYDEHFNKNIQHGLMVPGVLMGEAGANEGLGGNQMKDFQLHAKSIQKEIEKYLEEDIFFELVNVRVDWHWGEFTIDDVYKQMDVFSRLLKNPLTPEVRALVETKILRLLEKYDLEITPEMIKKNEEEKFKQAQIMGANKDKDDNGANKDKQTNRDPAGTDKRSLSKKEELMLDVWRNENL